jgi:hypothetical protein
MINFLRHEHSMLAKFDQQDNDKICENRSYNRHGKLPDERQNQKLSRLR